MSSVIPTGGAHGPAGYPTSSESRDVPELELSEKGT